MNNSYQIEGPALISFTGGWTSAYTLRQSLDASGGRLAENVAATDGLSIDEGTTTESS